MSRMRVPGGHRRTVKASKGDPGRVRRLKERKAREADGCRWPAPCDCLACEPEQ